MKFNIGFGLQVDSFTFFFITTVIFCIAVSIKLELFSSQQNKRIFSTKVKTLDSGSLFQYFAKKAKKCLKGQ